jgi:hypothetical protein
MTMTQTCAECGESRAYEELVGDRSDRCWREACRKRVTERARAYAERQARWEEAERKARAYARL